MRLQIKRPHLVSVVDGRMDDLRFCVETVKIAATVHFMNKQRQPTGQFGFKTEEGFLLPIDWEHFRPLAA
jgi:hypothetical protein